MQETLIQLSLKPAVDSETAFWSPSHNEGYVFSVPFLFPSYRSALMVRPRSIHSGT
jgi:hypothetical protein